MGGAVSPPPAVAGLGLRQEAASAPESNSHEEVGFTELCIFTSGSGRRSLFSALQQEKISG